MGFVYSGSLGSNGFSGGRMSAPISTAADLIEMIRARAPEYLDLLTANSEMEFDDALEYMIGSTITHLEANSANFSKLGEVELTADRKAHV